MYNYSFKGKITSFNDYILDLFSLSLIMNNDFICT